MRLSSAELSDSTTPPPPRRLNRRRQISPSPSATQSPTSQQPESEFSQPPDDPTDSDPNDVASQFGSSPNSFNSISTPIPPTYINIAPLPIFRGEPGECPLAHLSRFARVCRANNASTLDMVVRIFPVTLDAEAALWYELEIEPRPSISWDQIKSSFLNAFRRPEFADRVRSDLMSIRQGESESVNAFHLRMRWMLKRWPDHGLPDSLLKGLFVDGLREDFQDWIVPQRAESLAEAVRLALSWEQARSVREARRKCGFCDGAHEENGCEVRRRMRELWLRSKEGVVVGGLQEGGNVGIKVEGGPPPPPSPQAAAAAEGVGRVVSMGRRSQCQCWKHQCWKKYERSDSVVSITDGKNINNTDE